MLIPFVGITNMTFRKCVSRGSVVDLCHALTSYWNLLRRPASAAGRDSQALNNFSQPVVRDLVRQLHRIEKRKIG